VPPAATDPITSLLLDIMIGGAVGWVWEIATEPRGGFHYFLLGIAGAPVGVKIVDAIDFDVLGASTFVGAALGAAFFRNRRAPNVGALRTQGLWLFQIRACRAGHLGIVHVKPDPVCPFRSETARNNQPEQKAV
jgi:uncharacterized membrane protein YeaQ/YmgE (transglycosylase-associated protein family)